MTSKAKEALDDITGTDEFATADALWTYQDTIRRALTTLAAIESGELNEPHEDPADSMTTDDWYVCGWNDCLEHLKNIGEKN